MSEEQKDNNLTHSQAEHLDSRQVTYDVGNLIEQTRLVAAEYHKTTGQALPVTVELARFDVIEKLDLQKLDSVDGCDAREPESGALFLIKGRVIFKSGKARQKLGQINLDDHWQYLLMVIYDADYQPQTIHCIDRATIEREIANKPKDKRGSMTVAKYKALGKLVWSANADEQAVIELKSLISTHSAAGQSAIKE